ncbi:MULTISPECIES: DMT family transporter [Halomonadaceae]|uniref:DMT family transporter n=1 Tax=Halomonadaceae TaxID=28256 RepID=UPI00159B0BF9|nr:MULTISPECIES: DMT family transporter [Halomonas]QJQ95417.1 DMT family transporter [Halomonas sp. PA5]
MSASSSPRRAHLGMLLWALLVGFSYPAVGLIGEALPPMLLTALRFAIASLALWPLARGAREGWPGWRTLSLYALMGLCLAGFFAAMFWAAHRATAVSMATLFVSVPLLAFTLGLGARVERLAWRLPSILTLGAVGALGLAWAESRDSAGGLQFGTGEAVFFLGCVSSALYPVLSKWGMANGWLSRSASVRTFWSLSLGGVLVGIAGLVLEPVSALLAMTVQDLLVVAYLGLFSSAMTFWLQQRATAILTPGGVTAYSYLVPFVSMLVLFLQQPDQIGWRWLPGSLLVVLAIVLLLRSERHTD